MVDTSIYERGGKFLLLNWIKRVYYIIILIILIVSYINIIYCKNGVVEYTTRLMLLCHGTFCIWRRRIRKTKRSSSSSGNGHYENLDDVHGKVQNVLFYISTIWGLIPISFICSLFFLLHCSFLFSLRRFFLSSVHYKLRFFSLQHWNLSIGNTFVPKNFSFIAFSSLIVFFSNCS